ncbi:MFS transporter [Actinomadura mexicana]|uniref:Predicted arabinose efflux permease, MFS family n=1 Tax=Actinomadura mexicana TaxID=134959 RepID=A0A238ZER6_9ACTN|nr:MFS transporter [Actinomadura mexicana]SNR81572.1 Predicted arabinose efflux permease, MFS family [Actinomadura mexicana]
MTGAAAGTGGSLRAARLATFAYFTLAGFLLGMWIVHIPPIEHRTGIDHAVLGRVLLLLGAGAVVGMRVAGPLTDRAGARGVAPLSAAAAGAALVLPGLAGGAWTLGAALLVLGAAHGALDVAMNAHAVQVERDYGRPVMAAFHAAFSLGGVLAALAGARTLTWGWSPAATFGMVAILSTAVGAAAAPALLRSGGTPDTAAPPARRRTPRRIRGLAALAFMIMLCEGVANDWSVLHLRDLGASPGTAALAFGAFSAAMTGGRLLADRVAARYGPVAVLRNGTVLAASGLTVAALSPWAAPALIGWAVLGAGLSGAVPQLFSAAGHHDRGSSGANVSRVAGLGYLGMLAGPAVIGPLTRAVPLGLTLLLPVALCVVAAAAAGLVRPRPGAGLRRTGRETEVRA